MTSDTGGETRGMCWGLQSKWVPPNVTSDLWSITEHQPRDRGAGSRGIRGDRKVKRSEEEWRGVKRGRDEERVEMNTSQQRHCMNYNYITEIPVLSLCPWLINPIWQTPNDLLIMSFMTFWFLTWNESYTLMLKSHIWEENYQVCESTSS